MSEPASTIPADVMGADALLEMLDRGVRHLPVVDATKRVIGVISDTDLMAVETRTPFHLRRAIARARTPEEVASAAAALPATVIALHDARVAADSIGRVIATVHDAITRRLIELALERRPVETPFTWLVLGSVARREAFPSSDQDSAVVWQGEGDDPDVRAPLAELAAGVVDAGARSGVPACPNGAVASKPLFLRSEGEWRRVAASWLDDPTQEKALILVSLVGDGRPVWGERRAAPLTARVRAAREHPGLLRLMARFALSHRPPTGFLRNLVVEHSGERKGRLDLKHGGLIPIVDLARWAGLKAGAAESETPARLRAARAAGVLSDDDGRMLQEAFTLVSALRLEHQVQQIRAGERPDDHLHPATLSPLTRSTLKDAFRAVAAVQRRIGAELTYGVV
jgi:CBS domain-containing protein